MGLLYGNCDYDECHPPYGNDNGNAMVHYIPWKTEHGCIINPQFLASAFGHLPKL